MTTETLMSVFGLFLPDSTFEWFDIIKGAKDDNQVTIILKEKNIPPITSKHEGKKVTFKGYKDITILDFPVRGRKTLLTFRRRYWKIENQKEYLKRNIELCAEGTQLEKEFALFLKERS